MTWQPTSLLELQKLIAESESRMQARQLELLNRIKIPPSRWSEKVCGGQDGFWAVALLQDQVIWYNDIEEGFKVSPYPRLGEIGEYWANQDELDLTIRLLLERSTL